MKQTILSLLIVFISINTQAQEHFELEASTGWTFFNLINSPEYEFDDACYTL